MIEFWFIAKPLSHRDHSLQKCPHLVFIHSPKDMNEIAISIEVLLDDSLIL